MSLREHCRARWRVLTFVTALALGSAAGHPSPPARSVDGLAGILGKAAGGSVRAADLVWEPPRGLFTEALFGRRIFFLAAVGPRGDKDLFRSRVRVSREGHPIEVLGAHNLTHTPLGDESALEIRERTVAFATTALGRVQGVTVIDLSGPRPADRAGSLAARAVSHLDALLRTGSPSPLGETSVVWERPPRSVRVVLQPPRLHIDAEEPASATEVDLASGTLTGPTAADMDSTVSVVTYSARHRDALPWIADLVRPALASLLPSWGGRFVEGALGIVRSGGALVLRLSAANRAKGAAAPVPASPASSALAFPPPDVPPIWQSSRPGEGHWEPVRERWLARVPGAPPGSPAYFYSTILRPDPGRPSSEVSLVALDMTLLELGFESGYEVPRSRSGPPGAGRIPRADLPRVVGAFNGGATSGPGRFGARARHRDLVPPSPDVATVMVTDGGEVGLGPWGPSTEIPGRTRALRQSAATDESVTERSALCRLGSGHLVFASGEALSRDTLHRAMKAVQCRDTVELDSGRSRTGMFLVSARDHDPERSRFEAVRAGTGIDPRKYLSGSDRDFFYVMLRDTSPAPVNGVTWSPSPGAQPAPAWMPAVFEARRNLGELEVRLTSFEAGRVRWVLRAGTEEPGTVGGQPKKVALEADLEKSALAAVGLGHTTDALRYGLAFEGGASLELRQSYATLVLSPSGPPRIFPPGRRPTLTPEEDAVQLPLLTASDDADPGGLDRGSLRLRGAACVTSSGGFLVATARHDSSEPLLSALLEAGCSEVVALDRGSRHPAFVQRAGTDDALQARSSETVLHAVSIPMMPHTFSIE